MEVLRISSPPLEAPKNEDPLTALYRAFGTKRLLPRCKCKRPCSHGHRKVYVLKFEKRFPKPRSQEAHRDYHLRVTLWMVGECLSKGIPPPELSEASISSNLNCRNLLSNVPVVLSLIGKAFQDQ